MYSLEVMVVLVVMLEVVFCDRVMVEFVFVVRWSESDAWWMCL